MRTFRRASGAIRNARKSKTPLYGFTTNKTKAKRAVIIANKTVGKNYKIQPGYLLSPK